MVKSLELAFSPDLRGSSVGIFYTVAENFDLFGDPVPEHWGKRGRPAHIPTSENINKVMMMTALGWSNGRMQNALGIVKMTFRKHYLALVKQQRSIARDRLDAAYAMHLWKQVQEGNAGAMRLWMVFMQNNDRMGAEAAMGATPADKPAADKLGKKVVDQQRALDADEALMADLEQEATAQDAAARH